MDAHRSATTDHPRRAGRVELKQLRSAVLVSTSGSLRKAADLMGVRHSAMSRSVAQLEQLVGITLFERSPAGTRPTVAGQRFLARAGTILDEIDALVGSTLEGPAGCEGGPPEGLAPSIPRDHLGVILRDLAQCFRQVEVTVTERPRDGCARPSEVGLQISLICPRN
jgi:DNA-binding transcriptional LysR family regulator